MGGGINTSGNGATAMSPKVSTMSPVLSDRSERPLCKDQHVFLSEPMPPEPTVLKSPRSPDAMVFSPPTHDTPVRRRSERYREYTGQRSEFGSPLTSHAADGASFPRGSGHPSLERPPILSQRGTTQDAAQTGFPVAPSPGKPQHDVLRGVHTDSNGRRVQKRTSVGPWDFVKSIGAGSMAQVKLAIHRYTRQTAAIKIIPKAAVHRAHNSKESAEAKDARVFREAALGKLVHHPNISQLYEIYSMTSHYYLVFEYIAGGQMLGYIITHGCVKEQQARRFARSIAGALDYCHRNSIVHRDLKIENILISDTGEIKLIDFGLSNLYKRDALLKTFCGSLYFAAPELLNALPYVGPEVDVWSFGVVLYVLVCGKVPFEDKSMSRLHAKIKRGFVEYPGWLSPACVDLLSRMLVVDPSNRATMEEIIKHPWMLKGFDGCVDSQMPDRVPLNLPLDPNVIHEMAELKLGSSEDISRELETVLSSEPYATACKNWHEAYIRGQELSRQAPNPLCAYHPLISMYMLTSERLQRLSSVGSPRTACTFAEARDNRGRKPTAVCSPMKHEASSTGKTTGTTSNVPISPPPLLADVPITIPRTRAATHVRSRTIGGFDTSIYGMDDMISVPTPMTPVQVDDNQQRSTTPSENSLSALLRRISIRRRTSNGGDARNHERRPSVKVSEYTDSALSSPICENNESTVKSEILPIAVDSGDVAEKPDRRVVSLAAPPPRLDSTSAAVKHSSNVQSGSQMRQSAHARTKSSGHRLMVRETQPTLTDKSMPSIEAPKQVYFRSFFSVQSTSTRPLVEIRAELIRALTQLNIEFVEIKGGFSCRYSGNKTPSVLSSPQATITRTTSISSSQNGGASSVSTTDSHRHLSSTGSPFKQHKRGRSSISTRDSDYSLSTDSVELGGSDMLGEEHHIVNSPVRFEISIVRVPLLALHGLQFKKLSGNVWRYKTIAQNILSELRL